MLPVFNALSKNLAHNSPQIEIFDKEGISYEKVFGHRNDVFSFRDRFAAVG
jgi:hypothetical protein